MVAGRELSPKDAANTARLMRYWSIGGVGGAEIGWGVPGDFDKCVVLITKAIADGGHVPSPDMVKGLCANLHRRNTGASPGHAPAELALKGK